MQKNPIHFLMKTGWQYAGKYRAVIVACTLAYVIAQALVLCEPYVIGRMLNAVQSDLSSPATSQSKLFNDVLFFLSIYLAIEVGFWLFHGPARIWERASAFHICLNYKTRMFQCVTALPLKWHREHHSGETIDKINRATNGLMGFFEDSFEVVYMIARLVGTIGILFWYMPLAACAAAGTAVIGMIVIALIDRVLMRQYDELNRRANFAASALHDYITNIVSVITLRLQDSTLLELTQRIRSALPVFRTSNLLNEWKWAIICIMVATMVTVVLASYVHLTLAAGKVLMAGTFFALFEYLRRIGDSFQNFCEYYGRNMRLAIDVRAAHTITQSFEELSGISVQAKLPAIWQNIAVRNLNFTYEDDEHRAHHLQNVNIELKLGGSIAFVGESGSGKSTLLTLLRGLRSAPGAELYVDGEKMVHGLLHLACSTTLMPQDPEIFADTIRFNITFGIDASEEEIMDAVRAARFEGVLERLPKRLETNIAEKGVNLSGGEKQRLALARGIFFARSSKIILLDEPTSSVDVPNERMIYTSLMERFSNRCLISSVHKLHLLEMFDHIYVLADGVIVEEGSFAGLIATDGALASMWQHYKATQEEIVPV